eukprot:3576588-Alexandrium_andersonii.AAC.1
MPGHGHCQARFANRPRSAAPRGIGAAAALAAAHAQGAQCATGHAAGAAGRDDRASGPGGHRA